MCVCVYVSVCVCTALFTVSASQFDCGRLFLVMFIYLFIYYCLTVVVLDVFPSFPSNLSPKAAGTQDGWEDGDSMMYALLVQVKIYN